MTQALEQLVQAVQTSAKYRHISPDLIALIGARELSIRRNLKEAIKETKNKLHQVAGAYLDTKPPYAAWLDTLNAAAAQPESLKRACAAIMQQHASTRERAPILETFYTTLFAALPPVRSLLDVACGLNPLALPWMPLPPDSTYYACDLYADMAAFLNGCFALLPLRGVAEVRDVISAPPPQRVDLALVLKTLPVLEQVQRDAGRSLLRALNAAYLLVSFPTHSLGGRDRQMPEQYAARFTALAAEEGWPAQRFDFATEMVFVVKKGHD